MDTQGSAALASPPGSSDAGAPGALAQMDLSDIIVSSPPIAGMNRIAYPAKNESID